MKRFRPSTAWLVAWIGMTGALLVGCSDMLEPEVYSELTPETFFSSEADFNSAVVALYNAFSTDWGTTDLGDGQWYAALYNHDRKTYWARSEITTDEYATGWDQTFTTFSWGPATFSGEEASNYMKIRYVARATDVIDKIEKSTAPVPEHIKARYIAEAKVLRAWLMYILYDFFGPVNVKLDPATLYSTEITPRPSREEYVAAIERDLQEAIPHLPDKYNDDPANWGRVSKGVARMLLLRLYMHEKRWAEAENVARELMNMGYTLMPEYTQICEERNPELIYAVPADASSPNWYWMEILPNDFASAQVGDQTITGPQGWGGFWMPWDFYDQYEAGDKRLYTILDSYTNVRGQLITRQRMRGAIPLKCIGDLGTSAGAEIDWPVFRYAEVLLSLAEAINEQRGPTAEALQYVNMVRERAGVAPWTPDQFTSKEQLRDSLLVERGRELYSEGVRRQDLIRHGKFIEYAQRRGINAQPHHVLFPIPQFVIDQSGGVIEQNPGY